MILTENGFAKAGRGARSQSMQSVQSAVEAISGTFLTWTNQPAGLTEWNLAPAINRRNIVCCLDNDYGYIRVACGTAGATNAEVTVQYSTDNGANWNYFQSPDGPWCPLDANTVTHFNFVLPSAARIQDLWLRTVGRNGDGTADPTLLSLMGLVNQARDPGSNTPSFGDRPPAWKSTMSHKRTFFRGRQTTSFSGTWTNMPSALTAVPNPPMPSNNPLPTAMQQGLIAAHAGYIRHLTNVGTPGNTGATLRIQYSTNSGSSWQYIDSETGNTGAPIAIDVAGLRYSSFVKIDRAFFNADPAQLQMRLVGLGGNGAIDPSFVLYAMETTEYDPSTY